MRRLYLIIPLIALLHVATPAGAIQFGGQLVYGNDTDLGLGARVEIPTPDILEATRIEVDFNWYFPDDPPFADLTFVEFDGNWVYTLDTSASTGLLGVYLGGGLNLAWARIDPDVGGSSSDTDLGINFLGGVEYPFGTVSGFGEIRITVAGSDQYTLAIGLKF